MIKVILSTIVLSFFVSVFVINAQGIHSYNEAEKDTNSISHFFEKGHFYGHVRSFTSVTINKGALTDYYAQAIGAGIGYETPKFINHIQVGLSGFFMFNLASSNLTKIDPITGQTNRYEIGLFDIQRPNDHEDLDRLEELFLKYHITKKTKLTIGRQIPQSPFINPQDGRMRPTLIEAAVLDIKESKYISLHAEYIWRISPRSTVSWFNIGESMGLYSVGVGVNGNPSQYKGNIESNGIGVGGITYQKKQINIQIWDTYLDNVMNTLYAKAEWKSKIFAGRNWLIGGQIIQQYSVGNGGNSAPALTYFQPNSSSKVFSGRIGRQSTKFDWFLNATRITSDGRFLMPREWGREPFYTFMPRERNEGFGNLKALTLNTFFKPNSNLKAEISGGYFQLPDVKNFKFNKYGMPSYSQINFGLTYQFNHYFKGLNAQLLLVRKNEIGNTYQNDRYVLNKVDMTHFNIIINYHY